MYSSIKYVWAFAILLPVLAGCVPQEVSLLPKPQSLEGSKNSFNVKSGFKIEVTDEKLDETSAYLAAFVDEWNEYICKDKQLDESGALPVSLALDKIGNDNPEAYELSVDKSGIMIKAYFPQGCFYGIQTLRQLVKRDNGVLTLPQVKICDYPDFGWRSYLLDEARHFYGKEFVKKMLDELAALKINKFHWHLTDDAGWRIEIKKYPKLTEIGGFRNDTEIGTWESGKRSGKPHGGFYTQDDIKEIIEYARLRHIQVIPEIEMPGHASAAIAAYPWLGILGELKEVPAVFGKHKDSYNIASPEVITFLQDVLDEVCELFPSEVIHVGGDEVLFATWSASEEMKSYMKKNGLNSPADAQIKFTNDMSNYLESKGKRMMGWNEIMGKNVHNFENTEDYGQVATTLSKKTVIHFWRGEVELITEAAQKGYQIVNSLHTDTYLDYDYEKSPLKHMYQFSPIPEGLEKQYEKNIIGVGVQMWTEWQPTYKNVEYQTFPRIAAASEIAWSGAGDYDDFLVRLKNYSTNWTARDINFPVEEIK